MLPMLEWDWGTALTKTDPPGESAKLAVQVEWRLAQLKAQADGRAKARQILADLEALGVDDITDLVLGGQVQA